MSSQFILRWPVDSRVVTQRFGENPALYARFNQAGHEGLDFQASVGSAVYACADGEVFQVRPNDGNAYGLHVRVRHPVAGGEYQTVYAHLSKALVSVGQSVRAGECVGLAGVTGHTLNPHLHLTLKLVGARTPGYPDGVIDPFPYLQAVEPVRPSGLTVYAAEKVRLRAGPTTASAQLAWIEQGEALAVLGGADVARARVGQMGQWLQVRRAGGMDGFVAAWYVQWEAPASPLPTPAEEAKPALPESLAVYAAEALNVRLRPTTGSSRVAIALPHEPLAVVGDWEEALAKIGDRSEWLQVRLPDGVRGYVAAWYVRLNAGPAPEALLTVYPTEDMNMRQRPMVQSRRVGSAARNVPLVVHDDPARARALVGRYDEWLFVEAPGGQRAWVAAWYVSTEPTP